MNKDVIQFCGEYPKDFVSINIASSPDFVFEPDGSFSSVKLHDIDGNTVFVNSFIECEHYVVGGWNYNYSEINNFSYTELSVILIVAMSIHFLFNKNKKQKTYKI